MHSRFDRQKTAAALVILLASGCSHAPQTPLVSPIETPEQVPALSLPHPESYEINDLNALFFAPNAPAKIEGCFSSQHELMTKTKDLKEIQRGVREIIADQPTLNHWCFYQELKNLNDELIRTSSALKRQETVLKTYRTLVPVARAFQMEFKDSRYLRWAIQSYRRISPTVFFHQVDLKPETTSALVMIENPFSEWRSTAEGESVLEKYGIQDPKAQAKVIPFEKKTESTPPAEDEPEQDLLESSPAKSAKSLNELEKELIE